MIPVIEEAALRAAITPARAVEVIREAFRADGEGRTTFRRSSTSTFRRGEFHVKTAHIEGVPHIAVKIASGFYDNLAKGLPSGSGLMALFDATTGLPAALLLDNGFLTDIRTGAAGAVAAECLARAIATVGVIGSGVQARHQIRCLRAVRDFARIVAWSPTRARLETYCDEMRREGYEATRGGPPRRSAPPPTCSSQRRRPGNHSCAPVAARGMHVTAVGSDSPGKQELTPSA